MSVAAYHRCARQQHDVGCACASCRTTSPAACSHVTGPWRQHGKACTVLLGCSHGLLMGSESSSSTVAADQ